MKIKKNEYKSFETAKNKLINLSEIKFKFPQIPQFNKPFYLVISAIPEYIVLSEFNEQIVYYSIGI